MEQSDDPDYLASARRMATELLPMLKGLAEAAHNPEWADKGVPVATYAMMMSAALHQMATAEMAVDSNREPDAEAMMIGMKVYAMMWNCMVNFERVEPVFSKAETMH